MASLLTPSSSMESGDMIRTNTTTRTKPTKATNDNNGDDEDDDDDDVQIVFITCLTCGNVASQQPGRRKKTICPFCGNFYDMEAANAARSSGVERGGGGREGASLPAIESQDVRSKSRGMTVDTSSQGGG